MKLASVEIENFRAIEKLTLALDPRPTVLHGANAHGKTSVLDAIAAGLGAVPDLLFGVFERGFLDTDLRVGTSDGLFVVLNTTDGISWSATVTRGQPARGHASALKDKVDEIQSDHDGERPVELPIVSLLRYRPGHLRSDGALVRLQEGIHSIRRFRRGAVVPHEFPGALRVVLLQGKRGVERARRGATSVTGSRIYPASVVRSRPCSTTYPSPIWRWIHPGSWCPSQRDETVRSWLSTS